MTTTHDKSATSDMGAQFKRVTDEAAALAGMLGRAGRAKAAQAGKAIKGKSAQAQDFAKARPGLAMGLAAGAGFVAARVLRRR